MILSMSKKKMIRITITGYLDGNVYCDAREYAIILGRYGGEFKFRHNFGSFIPNDAVGSCRLHLHNSCRPLNPTKTPVRGRHMQLRCEILK